MNTVNYNDAEQLFGAVGTSLKKHTAEIADIVNVYGAKNLLENTLVSATKNNVTVTLNDDGTITVNASTASSAETDFAVKGLLASPLFLKAGQYILSGGASNDCYLYVRKRSSFTILATSTGGDGLFTVTSEIESDGLSVQLHCNSGKTFNNVKISPMIRLASIEDDTYVPYVPTNRQLLSHKDNGILGAKNRYYGNKHNISETTNGLTIDFDNDGIATISGTATAITWVNFNSPTSQVLDIPSGSYILNGIEGGSNITYQLQLVDRGVADTTDVNVYVCYDGDVAVQIDNTHKYRLQVVVRNGQTLSNKKFKPMIRLASDSDNTYQPYAKTNKKLTDDIASLAARIKAIEDVNHLTWG